MAPLEEHLTALYLDAPPIGVTLIIAAACTGVAGFAERHPQLFRDKTARIIHLGGALLEAGRVTVGSKSILTGQTVLGPDPAAANNRVDLEAARAMYHCAQEMSVPLVILSRHVAHACRLPRQLFDMLLEHCGSLGAELAEEQRSSTRLLWQQACAPLGDSARGSLADRCDRNWFLKTFCRSADINLHDTEDIWPYIESLHVYNPLSMLAAVPAFVQLHLRPIKHTVRSAQHLIVGVSETDPGVEDRRALRSFVCRCLMKASIANQAEFHPIKPPPIRLSFCGEAEPFDETWSFDASEDAY
mmetsp:Transcript_47914/g.158786  ORF Transcript_47914/g.158786 Transcript_47914/m.158786 type:complete len:301 (-) Transcript_47914:260-1162(-)